MDTIPLLEAWQNPLETLDMCAGHTPGDICRNPGAMRLARRIIRLSRIWCEAPEEAREAVVANRHTFDTLETIETYARRSDEPWAIRRALADEPADFSTLHTRGTELTRPARPVDPVPAVSYRPIPGTTSAHLTFTGPQHLLKAKFDAIKPGHEMEALFNPSGEPRITPLLVAGVKDFADAREGKNNDMVFTCNNGALITGYQVMQALVTSHFWATLFSPRGDVLGVYPGRFAPDGHRLALTAMDPKCTWPGCNRPAASCQVNHNEPHAHGGPTAIANESHLCEGHNKIILLGEKRGRVVQIDGVNYFQVPGSGKLVRNWRIEGDAWSILPTNTVSLAA